MRAHGHGLHHAPLRTRGLLLVVLVAAAALDLASGFLAGLAPSAATSGRPPRRGISEPSGRRRGYHPQSGAITMVVPAGYKNPNPQSVLVVGAGAVGCVYGGRLLEAGHDVAFLMRREYEAVKEKGLKITSADGDLHFPSPTIVRSTREYAELRGGKHADWVVLALKTTSFHEIPSLLGNDIVGPETRVLVLMNGYGLETDLAQWVDGQRVFGGMAFICANRGPHGSGEVYHLKYGKLVVGNHRDDPSELARAQALWAGAKVEVETSPSLLRARWMKLVWNVPFNGIGCILGGKSVDHIVQTPELRQLASRVMLDVIKAANAELSLAAANGAAGARAAFRDLDEAEAAASWSQAAPAPAPTAGGGGGAANAPTKVNVSTSAAGDSPWKIDRSFYTHMMELTDVMGPYMSSTVLDLLASKPMETEYMFLRPLQRANELGVSVPHMEGVCLAVEGIRKTRKL